MSDDWDERHGNPDDMMEEKRVYAAENRHPSELTDAEIENEIRRLQPVFQRYKYVHDRIVAVI